MSARKGMNLKRVKNQLELLEGILEQDATSRHKNISSRCALRIAQACVNKQIGQKPLAVEEYNGKWVPIRYSCQQCGGSLCNELVYYCPNCGQKIDWSEEEKNGKANN